MNKILIVDDSDVLRIQLKEVLEGAGYEVVEGKDGLDGLEQATKNLDIKLVISDYNMPEMDGVSMCTKIKEIDEFKEIPMFMLTTETSIELKNLGKKAGVKAWIVKPFVPEKVIKVVQKVVG